MVRVSSNFTIFLKLFIPAAWITFFGLMTLSVLIVEDGFLPFGGGLLVRAVFLAIFLFFFALIYFFLLPLKRVEMGPDGVYVSNYFKTYRYQFVDIEKIKERDLGFRKIGTITLKEKGKFGKKIRFIISPIHYQDFINDHPDLFQHLIQ